MLNWLKAVIMKDIPNLQASAPKIARLSNSHVQHKTVLDTNYNKFGLLLLSHDFHSQSLQTFQLQENLLSDGFVYGILQILHFITCLYCQAASGIVKQHATDNVNVNNQRHRITVLKTVKKVVINILFSDSHRGMKDLE